MKKKIMILGASILQLPAIKKAKEMGLLPIVVDMNPRAVGFSEGNILKEVISTIDIPAVVDAAKRHRVDGVMTLASDMPMRCVAAVAKELGIVGISDETAIKATDKGEMRKALAAHNVPIPKFHVVSSKQEFDEIVPLFTTPFIVKPADNSGSRGVIRLSDSSDKAAVDSAYEYSLESSRNGKVVVEEFMEGPEVSVETLSVDGNCHVIQITDKITGRDKPNSKRSEQICRNKQRSVTYGNHCNKGRPEDCRTRCKTRRRLHNDPPCSALNRYEYG